MFLLSSAVARSAIFRSDNVFAPPLFASKISMILSFSFTVRWNLLLTFDISILEMKTIIGNAVKDMSRIFYFQNWSKLMLNMSHNGLHADWLKSVNLRVQSVIT